MGRLTGVMDEWGKVGACSRGRRRCVNDHPTPPLFGDALWRDLPPALGLPCCCLQFIYISTEEMQAVAKFITNTGRVRISDLAAKSNTFIDLEPKAAAAVATEARPAIDFDSLLGADEQ